MKFHLVFLFVFVSTFLFGQSQNEKLAYQYFSGKQYEKAIVLYADLHKAEPVKKYYEPYLQSLLFLEQYKNAEKLVKRHMKKNPERLEISVDLGYVYEKWGKQSKADKVYQKTISKMIPNVNSILGIGNSFLQIKKYDHAIKVYKKGRKLLDDSYPFAFEMAKVYEVQGNLTKMSQSLIGVMDFGIEYQDAVKNSLAVVIEKDVSGKRRKVIHTELLSKVQKDPDNVGLTEILIWFYLQEKKFNAALLHAKALDKRNKESGKRILDLASIFSQNKEFKTAIKAYQYLLDKGDENYFYRKARVELVKVLNYKINEDPNSTYEDIQRLDKSYQEALKELGENAYTIDLMKGYAHLKAFHLNQIDEAKEILQRCIALKRARVEKIAGCKIELGDIYVMENEIWEAALLYGQVNHEFKEDPIGHEAKLRTAKAYFYAGEFEWSKAQLDVLKASTTKLISNDAMQLSILISDNLNMDTSTVPLEMFAKADLLHFQNLDSIALLVCDSLIDSFPKNATILDDVYFMKADIFVKAKNWEKALENYQKAVDYQDLLKDDALFEMGLIYLEVLNQPNKALKCFETIVLDHQDSIYSIEARKRFRKLRGDKI